MPFVFRMGNRFQELGVTPDTAHVLRRAGSFPVRAAGILDAGFGARGSFQFEGMLPAVAEVVLKNDVLFCQPVCVSRLLILEATTSSP